MRLDGRKTTTPIAEVMQHRLMPIEKDMFPGMMAFKGAGCDKCENTGYRSRLGYYEMMLVTPAMRTAITAGRTSSQELLATVPSGHVTMRRDGLIKASQGQTTVDEVLRATQDAEA